MSVVVLGHRGGRGEGWPAENSLAAFQRALDEGADGVELDVRRCASGELVLHHDPRLPDGRRLTRLRRSEIPSVIPSLDDALDLCAGRFVNVEIKADDVDRLRLVRAVGRAIRGASPSTEIVVSSFDPFVVAATSTYGRRVRRGMLVGARTPRLAVHLPIAMSRIVAGAHLQDPLVDERRVARLLAAELFVLAWTVNEPARARALAAMGVTMIITDRPRAIVDALSPVPPSEIAKRVSPRR